MATEALTTSRRALIGALAISPAVMASPSAFSATDGRAEWNAALAAYEAAEAARRQYNHQTLEPAEREWERIWGPKRGKVRITDDPKLSAAWKKFSALSDRYSDLIGARGKAIEHVVVVPAPDGAALARKMEIACQEHDDIYEFDAEWVAIFIADARRLGARA